jgi:endonuclease III
MPIDNNTLIEDLTFKQAHRLRRAVNQYNRVVDKSERITTVAHLKLLNDLYKDKQGNSNGLVILLGVGPKTAEYTVEFLKGLEPCS